MAWRAPTARPVGDQSRVGDEELDRASALSLGEDAKRPIGRTNNDEDLDRALQESSNTAPYRPYNPTSFFPRGCKDYYEGMNMKIDQQIPMLLVERQALNEAMEGEKIHHHMPETRGLCLSEEQTVSSILRRPRIGGNRIVDMRTHPQKLTRKCEVTAILVLLLTGSILAHELMHGWLRLKGYRNLSPEVEEGICQVLSYMWLESEVITDSRNSAPTSSTAASTSSSSTSNPFSKKGGKSDIEKKLGKFFIHQIAHDTSPAYGGGFRAANASVNKYGLRRTLDHIRLTGCFPV
ncbi:Protein DA1-related 2 [Acorus calamus]|uniref:Protein DA1-related 2 n=1 Tax=Acorus calamus TaxID=4465 RepID=A0AAV9DAT0_ACOCL|nr:Protein DA1-related 2 [Acorus calamus]